MTDKFPDDPMSPLTQGYTALHEMFKALTESGWTEDQAIKYVVYWSIAIGKEPELPEAPDGP